MKKVNAQTVSFSGKFFAEKDERHPLVRRLSFVFTDFQPNANKQGVPREEAENIIDSSLYMPIKIAFNGEKAQGHRQAVPIGPITSMTLSDDSIQGQAVVWADEFPDVVAFLDEAVERGEPINFSWEIFADRREKDEAGVEWLYGITSAGTTIVDNPAYRGRTPLLSYAERDEMTIEELQSQVSELTSKIDDLVLNIGTALSLPADGLTPELILSTVQSLVSEKSETALVVATLTTDKELLSSQVEELQTYKQAVEAAAHRAELLTSRRARLAEAGVVLSDSEFEDRADLIFSMESTVFELYVADLARMKPVVASIGQTMIPDPVVSSRTPVSVSDIAKALKSLKNEG